MPINLLVEWAQPCTCPLPSTANLSCPAGQPHSNCCVPKQKASSPVMVTARGFHTLRGLIIMKVYGPNGHIQTRSSTTKLRPARGLYCSVESTKAILLRQEISYYICCHCIYGWFQLAHRTAGTIHRRWRRVLRGEDCNCLSGPGDTAVGPPDRYRLRYQQRGIAARCTMIRPRCQLS
jgi:hypothetical protein